MDSDLSDVRSEVSEAEKISDAEEEMLEGYNDDDEDYIDGSDYSRKEVKPREAKRSNTNKSSATTNKRARTMVRNVEDEEEEELIPSRRRNMKTNAFNEEGEESEEQESEEEAKLRLEPEDQEENEIEEEGIVDDYSEDVEKGGSEIDQLEVEDGEAVERNDGHPVGPEDHSREEDEEDVASSALPDYEDEVGENIGDSLKQPTRSKMLLELLGDGVSKKNLTEEEIQLRRAENARKRKNLSEKRSEEEKQETINKLLRRRAGKSRSHLPNEEEELDGSSESAAFSKPRRPYRSKGLIRTLRRRNEDLYCPINE